MKLLFLVYGRWLRLRAQVREWYAFYFKTDEYFERIYPATAELRRQIEAGDWSNVRNWRSPDGG